MSVITLNTDKQNTHTQKQAKRNPHLSEHQRYSEIGYLQTILTMLANLTRVPGMKRQHDFVS